MSPSDEHVFLGQHVALIGKLSLLSKRDARAIVEKLGGAFSSVLTPRTTTIVVGVPQALDVPSHVRRVMTEEDLCREAGLPPLDVLRTKYYSPKDLRGMYSALRDDHLRYLEKWGLIRSVAGRFSFADVHVVRQAAAEIERGVSLHGLLRALSAEREGQLAFDFQPARSERAPARVVSLPIRPAAEQTLFPADRDQQLIVANRNLATKYFLEGAQLDDREDRDLDAAAVAYRRAALFDPQLVAAVVNLGNIHHDLVRFPEAVRAYRDALAINPAYPEAHFYLAVTLEKLGRAVEAKAHWREYRRLAPEGEFVELAKEFAD